MQAAKKVNPKVYFCIKFPFAVHNGNTRHIQKRRTDMETAFDKQGVTPESLKGTKTEQNLHTALSGESQAYLRYKWFEKKAKQDGYVEIAQIFCETAENEREHAEIWFKYLGGWSSTEKNLSAAAEGENFEWTSMYAQFAEDARAEGFDNCSINTNLSFSLLYHISRFTSMLGETDRVGIRQSKSKKGPSPYPT